MEEKREKKKINKKPLIICLAIALIFAVMGFVDIKVNASESGYSADITLYVSEYQDGVVVNSRKGASYSMTSSEPIYVYYYEISEPTTERLELIVHPVSSGELIASDNSTWFGVNSFNYNGNTWYRGRSMAIGAGGSTLSTGTFEVGGNATFYKLNKYYTESEFQNAFINGTLEYTQQIDYDNLPIDDDMPVISELKRNYIMNHYSSPGEEGITIPSDTYEYLLWSNTSDLLIQIETVPIVQYYKTLFGKSEFVEQFIGDWRDCEILESGTVKYLRQTDDASLLEKYNEDYQFKKTCLSERRVNVFTETAYFFYGYRLRYVDVENEKAGPWSVVMPSEIVNESEIWQEYSNGFVGNSSDSTGEVSDTNYGNIDKNLEEIEETIKFKDKYEIIDGNVDTQQAMNWLTTVTNFIKGTPQLVGEVLGFLPQPILYGMYVCIFLGVIASGIAIVKALI